MPHATAATAATATATTTDVLLPGWVSLPGWHGAVVQLTITAIHLPTCSSDVGGHGHRHSRSIGAAYTAGVVGGVIATAAAATAWVQGVWPGQLHAEHTEHLQLQLLLCAVRGGLQQCKPLYR